MRYPKVSIVMLCWNNVDQVLEFLKDIVAQEYPCYDIVIVNNHTTKGNVQRIKEAYPQVHIIHNEQNLGWGGANNVAFDYVFGKGADYVWTVNTDATLGPDTLGRLVKVAQEDERIGTVSPVVYFWGNKNRIQTCGSLIKWKKFILKDFYSIEEMQQADPEELVVWGTGLLIKRSVYERVGYFDTNIFIYWEDVEYTLRAKLAGFLNKVCPQAKIYHESHSVDIGGERSQPAHWFFYISRNEYYFWMKYLRGFSRLVFFRHYFLLIMERVIRYRRDDEMRKHINTSLDGYYCGVKRLTGEWKDDVHMPGYIKRFVLKYPCFVYDLVSGRFLPIIMQIIMRLRKKLLRIQT
jgi:GT2 family glycosyltransferase